MGFNANGVKVEDTGLSVRYDYEAEYEVTDEGESPTIVIDYLVRRYATKRYSYVGLSLAGAKTLAAAKTIQYTKWHRDGDLSNLACMASISIDKGDAGYRVNIDVNEEDAVRAENVPTSPGNLFDYINGTNYDEDIGSMLTLISRTRIGDYDVFDFSAKFSPINTRLLSVEYATVSYVNLDVNLDTMRIFVRRQVTPGKENTAMVVYGDVKSNVISFTE